MAGEAAGTAGAAAGAVAVGMPWVGAAMVGASVVSSLIGNEAARKDREAAKEAQARALDYLIQAGNPPDIARQIILQQYEALGMPQPSLLPEVEKQVSQMQNVQTDPSLKDAQINALRSLQQVGSSGMRPEDRALLQQIQDQMGQQESARQQGIMEQMQARGIAGGGAELAARLSSAQNSSNQGNSAGLQVASDASKRALEAIAGAGNLGGQIRSQDFSEQSAKAQAADEMNRFNIQNQISNNKYNTDAINSQKYQDWQNKQRVSDANVGQTNAEKNRQINAEATKYQLGLAHSGAMANAALGQATGYNTSAAQTQNMYNGIGQSISQGIGAYGQNAAYDRRTDAMAGKKPKTQAELNQDEFDKYGN